MAYPPFIIHLDLSELVELNEVLEHAKSGLIARGKAFHKDPKRRQNILGAVNNHFVDLATAVKIQLGNGAGSQRFLKAAFAWGNDPDVGGVSAQGLSRTKLGKFNRMGADRSKPVTGYIFEGVIGNWIVNYLGARRVSANNIFAGVISHELGHQLGLGHEKSPDNMMFVFSGCGRGDQIKWLSGIERNTLAFTKTQVAAMKELLSKP